MEIYVANLEIGESLSVNFEAEIGIPSGYYLNKELVKIEVSGVLSRHEKFFLFDGEAKTVLDFNCDSCLSPVTYLLAFHLTEKFSSEITDEDDIWELQGKFINLEQAVIMNLLLNIPIKFVCSDNCKGLCQVCGRNLNEGSCDCDNAPRDSKFLELSSFFEDEEV